MIGESMGTAVERSAKIVAAFGAQDHPSFEGLRAIQASNADDMLVDAINIISDSEASIDAAKFG